MAVTVLCILFSVILSTLKFALNSEVIKSKHMRYGIGASLLKNDNAFVLPAILLILNALDVLSTIYGLSRGALEMNPLFSYAVIPGKFLGCDILFIVTHAGALANEPGHR